MAMYSSIILQATPAWPLSDYEGGDNPALLYLAIGLALLAVGSALGYYLYARWRDMEFDRRCRQWGLSAADIGYLRGFIRRFHVKDPLHLIETGNAFEHFVNRIAHWVENAPISEEQLAKQLDFFRHIRMKVPASLLAHRKESTRDLSTDEELTIRFTDPSTNNAFTFDTTIIDNNDFFLGVEPPTSTEVRKACDFSKPKLEVIFYRDEVEYSFETRLARSVNSPEVLWLLRHSTDLIRGEPVQKLNMSATINALAGEEEKSREWPVIVHTMGADDCTLSLDATTDPLPVETTLLINLPLDNGERTIRGEVGDNSSHPQQHYRFRFSNITDEEKVAVLRHLRKIAKEQTHKSDMVTV